MPDTTSIAKVSPVRTRADEDVRQCDRSNKATLAVLKADRDALREMLNESKRQPTWFR
jgi:hypothetical protein